MAEKPLLIFPEPAIVGRHKKKIMPGKMHFPSPVRQLERLQPKFEQLERAFEACRVEMRDDPTGIEPEKVLVLETVGKIDDFCKALRGIEGLEWLADSDLDDITPDNDFYVDEEHPDKALPGRLYLIFSNNRGLQELFSLWKTFCKNPEDPQFQRGRKKWGHLFKQLKDIHPWGPEDRLFETGLLEDWQERVAIGEEYMKIEIELWFRQSVDKRNKSEDIVQRLVHDLHGRVIGQACCIEEIAYHAILAELPIQKVEAIFKDRSIQLVRCEQVMFFRPVGQAVVDMPDDRESFSELTRDNLPLPQGNPIVALLDGLPIENHKLLDGRLIVDDPENWAADYPVLNRYHGTAMASLLIHGELDASELPINHPLYVRPILKPDHRDWRNPKVECIPEDVLPVDLVHRSVRRLFEGEGTEPAVAPTVRIINLSIGDPGRPFDRLISPWARLLDYLSWKYQVLFIVSAGNYPSGIELNIHRRELSMVRQNAACFEEEVLKTIIQQGRNRRLLSPAEAINVLTIGAVHEDSSSNSNLGNRIDPFVSKGLPSPICAQGLGFRRSIKPDIFFPGGRQTYQELLGNTHTKAIIEINRSSYPPGQRVASPAAKIGNLGATRHMRGTSNATALASRTAVLLYDLLQQLKNEPGGDRLHDNYTAVLIKALLVHSASWGDSYENIKRIISDKNIIARLLGYGLVMSERVFECTDQRATMLGCGSLYDNEAHRYIIPLPPSISGKKIWRRVTVTLAWFTPINPTHRAYRKSNLWFDPYGGDQKEGEFQQLLQVSRQEADWQTVRRGTVQHEIFAGDKASSFVDEDKIIVQVNCRADAGKLTESIPYALVVTLEVAPALNLPVYNEIRTRIRQLVGITP
ncbi:S8 family peptidase [Desulfoscipio geothermicus]|uniref:Subtilase family protein n=1 Tax=Desulfoscipio geothermicus DSM 3669 TaxID=1121426 RepID=A0A1I6DP37_9FIRM|nr:S8 family peptidase [Desulfoscipio geothermicus]SFR07122.1 Subtilase family protein [Desulfoscipio geothermicus DSM 3669]